MLRTILVNVSPILLALISQVAFLVQIRKDISALPAMAITQALQAIQAITIHTRLDHALYATLHLMSFRILEANHVLDVI